MKDENNKKTLIVFFKLKFVKHVHIFLASPQIFQFAKKIANYIIKQGDL